MKGAFRVLFRLYKRFAYALFRGIGSGDTLNLHQVANDIFPILSFIAISSQACRQCIDNMVMYVNRGGMCLPKENLCRVLLTTDSA